MAHISAALHTLFSGCFRLPFAFYLNNNLWNLFTLNKKNFLQKKLVDEKQMATEERTNKAKFFFHLLFFCFAYASLHLLPIVCVFFFSIQVNSCISVIFIDVFIDLFTFELNRLTNHSITVWIITPNFFVFFFFFITAIFFSVVCRRL